jgi:hypothetical protein
MISIIVTDDFDIKRLSINYKINKSGNLLQNLKN